MNKKLYKLMNWADIEGIVYSEEDDPHRILGPHQEGASTLFQTFQPGAVKVTVEIKGEKSVKMEMMDEEGYFAALVPGKNLLYHYLVEIPDKQAKVVIDPYQFAPQMTKKDTDKFKAGIHYSIYDCLGAHPKKINGVEGILFAVWAPNAVRVSVTGDFNNWDGRVHQMRRLWDSGVFEIFIPGAEAGANYKYEIKLKSGLTYMKADPYAFGQQLRPENASVIRDIGSFVWEDEEWLTKRTKRTDDEPVSVYELYLGSFRKPEDGREYYTYRELAPYVIEYVKEMGYTHIELMPVMEHPFDASWGYQTIGYYAPTARYGTPEDFMYFMNEMHKAGIGVILDWVPAHFPRDVHGLSNFDGTCLYEHLDPRKGSHPHWGTLVYNYGRPQVSNYLIANALFWVEKYHADGIRMDAVASMLYLDYGRKDGEWIANVYGGNENLEAIEFLKHLNSVMKKRNKGVLSIAEESTAFPLVTGSLKEDGLGFDLKWNMGWMNDYLQYIKYDPYFRSHHHGELTFSMIYAYSEKYMLVFSHDEVVHGKSSMIGKMPGNIEDKFKNLRMTYGYMMMHPGKKLLFMGQDIGEFDEWNENRSVEWDLLEHDNHIHLNRFVKTLNRLYQEQPALYQLDTSSEGFEWINDISANESILVFLRKSRKEEETLLVVVNFANVSRSNYKIGVPYAGKYKEILSSDAKEFGGDNEINARVKVSKEEECDERPQSIRIQIAPLSVSVFAYQPYSPEELKEIAKKQAEKERRAKEAALRKEQMAKEKARLRQSLKEELAEKIAKAEAAIAAGSEPSQAVRKKRNAPKK